MNLFEGLEKFGIKPKKDVGLYEEEKKQEQQSQGEESKLQEPKEEDFLLQRNIKCPVCDKSFKDIAMKSGKAKRLEPDEDLRPRQMYIDSLKYGATVCPHCGYAALNRYFTHIASVQMKLIREEVTPTFKPLEPETELRAYTYDEAIERHKLSLFNAMAKKARTSEKAYNCLIISWLLRGKAEEIGEEQVDEYSQCKEEEEAFYWEAYEGLLKAVSSENFPICGMDANTMDYLLAAMARHYKQYDVASKCLARVLSSSTAGRKVKDMALDMKEQLMVEIKKM